VEILEQADALRKKRAEADVKAARILPALFYKMFGDPTINPKGWPVKKLGDPEVSIINPRFEMNKVPDDKEFSFVPMADVDEIWGRIVGKQVRPYAEVNRGFTPFRNDDVLFAKITPCMQNGKAAIARNLVNGHGFGSTEFHVLRAGAASTPEWLYGMVRLTWFRKQAEASFTGTAGQQRVPADFLQRYEVACPSKELQIKFANAVVQILTRADQADQRDRVIDQLFATILHRAFSGDLTARWREAHMKELLAEMEEQARALESKPEDDVIRINGKRHAGHDMYEKAALAAYITQKCHSPQYPLGRVKLAKIFYLVQRKAELELTKSFAKHAAGPLDDAIFKFMSLAKKKKWVSFGKKQGDLQPVFPGAQVQEAVESAGKLLGDSQTSVDALIDKIKSYGREALERWATVLHTAEELLAAGAEPSLQNIKNALLRDPAWKAKLKRDEFSDSNITSSLSGLRLFGFLPNNNQKG